MTQCLQLNKHLIDHRHRRHVDNTFNYSVTLTARFPTKNMCHAENPTLRDTVTHIITGEFNKALMEKKLLHKIKRLIIIIIVVFMNEI